MNVTAARNEAERLIQKFGITSPPVDVERIAQNLGLRVLRETLGEGVSGMLVTTPAENIVVLQRLDPKKRQRFTLAHEVGHHQLKHHFGNEAVHVDSGNFISRRSSISSTGLEPVEIEANQFAAALLMPAELLRRRIQEIGKGPLWDWHVSALADEFEVSEQAMTIRLTKLGYL